MKNTNNAVAYYHYCRAQLSNAHAAAAFMRIARRTNNAVHIAAAVYNYNHAMECALINYNRYIAATNNAAPIVDAPAVNYSVWEW